MPKFIQIKFKHYFNLYKIFHNISWLFLDKILRMFLGLLVGVWLARYLGPEKFGLWNYAISFSAIFGVIATLGLDSIVIRELVKNPEQQNVLMGSTFMLRVIASLLSFMITILVILSMRPDNSLVIFLVALSAAGVIFQSINVIDFYFQAQVNSKFTVYATDAALILMSAVKIVLLFLNASLVAFAWANLIEVILSAFFMVVVYEFNKQRIKDWKVQKEVIFRLLLHSWPLLLASLAVTIYMKIDMVMLQEMAGPKEVGVYAAATKLSEVWYFLPMVIISSISPSLIKCHETNPDLYLVRIKKLYFLMAWFAVLIAFPVSFMAKPIIRSLYGIGFIEASPVLAIHMWGSVAVFLGIASSQHLLVKNLQKISFLRTLLGLVLNVGLNILMIPTMGAVGASIATVISYLLATYSLVLFRSTRSHGFLLITSPFKR